MILEAWQLSEEDTWRDFLVWYGLEVGRLPEHDLEAKTDCPETRALASAELRRRAALEDA